MHQHEQLAVWKRSRALAATLHRRAATARGSFALTAWPQIVRASASVPANIAEGAMRSSNRDFARFLSISIGSAAELQTLLLIAGDCGLVPADEANAAATEAREIRLMLVGLRARVMRLPRQPILR
ncbi:MAG: four helix bundle protein [Gemmatimonadetes bacterium]|nr:four helix bundle protein [Gemmatimonadota bacterium]